MKTINQIIPTTKIEKPNIELARRILRILDFGLCYGGGAPVSYKVSDDQQKFRPGQVCVEQAISVAAGFPNWGDGPRCVHREIAEDKRRLNDYHWSSNKSRALGMRAIAIAQLGSDKLSDDQIEQYDRRVRKKLVASLLTEENLLKLSGVIPDNKSEVKYAFDILKSIDFDSSNWSKDLKERINASPYDARSVPKSVFQEPVSEFADSIITNLTKSNGKVRDGILSLVADAILSGLKLVKSPGCKWLYLLDQTSEQIQKSLESKLSKGKKTV